MAMKPRILIVITKGVLGGAQQFVLDLATGLRKQKQDVTVAFGEGEFLADALRTARIPTHRFDSLMRSASLFSNLYFVIEFFQFIRTSHFDVIHFNSSNALLGAIAAKCIRPSPKTVFTFHGLSFLDPHHRTSFPKRIFYWIVFRFLLLFIDTPVFVAETNFLAAQQVHLVSRGIVIPISLNHDAFTVLKRAAARKTLNQKKTFVIGSIGRLAYPKNYGFFIRAIATLRKTHPRVTGCIIGDGPNRQMYTRLIRSLHLEDAFQLLGAIPYAAQYLSAFDAFVLPSVYEGFSVSILEALAAGIPVIASDVGGNREVLADAGLLYPLDDTKKFIAYAQRIIDDRAFAKKLSLMAQKRAKQFDIKKTIAAYSALYISSHK